MTKCKKCDLPLLEELCLYNHKEYSRMCCLNCEDGKEPENSERIEISQSNPEMGREVLLTE